MEEFRSQSPNGSDNNSPLVEIRAYLTANQQVVRTLEAELKETSIEGRMALQRIAVIEGSLLVIDNRLNRIDKDADIGREERQTQKQIVWGALLAALLAVAVPFVVRPGVVNSSPSVGQVK